MVKINKNNDNSERHTKINIDRYTCAHTKNTEN